MVHYCVVIGCPSRAAGPGRKSFFRIPAVIKGQGEETLQLSLERRRSWIKAINRKNFRTSVHSRICEDHFHEGKPAKLYQKSHPDWVPSVNLGDNLSKDGNPPKVHQYHDLQSRYSRQQNLMESLCLVQLVEEEPSEQIPLEERLIKEEPADRSSDEEIVGIDPQHFSTDPVEMDCCVELSSQLEFYRANCDRLNEQLAHSTDECSQQKDYIEQLELAGQNLRQELAGVKEKLSRVVISEVTFMGKDKMVNFYTGLPTWDTLFSIFSHLKTHVSENQETNSLSLFQQFILVLMRLRLNLLEADLAYRFDIHQSTVSATLRKWTDIMFDKLCPAPTEQRDKIESVIGNVKKKYSILQGPFPSELMDSPDEDDTGLAEKILYICHALYLQSAPAVSSD